MRITRVETIPVRVPIVPARAVRGARGAHLSSPFLLVLVHTDEVLVGLGEVSCTPNWSGEDSATAARVIDAYLAPAIVGEDPTAPERLGLRLRAAVHGNVFARAGVEMALWDLAGKAAELPLNRLLGGPVRPHVRTKFSVSGVAPDEAAAIASWAVEQGFGAIKVKVGVGLAADLARVAAVRAAVGDDILLGVDANGGWSRAEARGALRPLRELGVAFIEQPLAPRELAGLADLRRSAEVPIVADESVGTPEEALAVVRAEAADVLSVYVGMAGGIAGARRVAAIAEAAGLDWTIGSNLELGIGLAAHLHVATALPALADDLVPCDVISPFYYGADVLAEPLAIEAGRAFAPDAPGLGVELDPERVRAYRDDR